MTQVEQLVNMLDIFENKSSSIRTKRFERAQVFFRAVEDLENSWFAAIEELAHSMIEKMNNDLLEDISDDLATLLSDRDSLIAAIQGSHDIHLGKLLALE